MTGPGPERGWKDRRDKANAKSAAHDERAAIRAERARAEQERIDAGLAAAAEWAKREASARCSCPVCGDGIVETGMAARIIEAMRRLPANEKGDAAVLATINAIVEGAKPVELAAAYSTDLGLKRPRKVYASAPPLEHGEHAVVTRDDHRTAVVTPKEPPIAEKPKRKPTQAEIYAADGDENALDLG